MRSRLIEKLRRRTRVKHLPQRARPDGTHLPGTEPNPTRLPKWLVKAVFVLIGVVLVWFGAFPMLGGFSSYRNAWGMAFAPIAIIFGAALIYGVLFKFDEMRKPQGSPKSRFRGWPRRYTGGP